MKSSDLFDLCNKKNEEYKNKRAFASAQSAWDNASPEDYGYSEQPETPDDEVKAFEAYKFAMKLALDALNKQMELYNKYGKNDIADLIDNEIDEITKEIARRESRII